jgi:hypothetical protein
LQSAELEAARRSQADCLDLANLRDRLGSGGLEGRRVAAQAGLPYVYLGYWVQGSVKMANKARFNPIEVLRPGGWTLMAARDRD